MATLQQIKAAGDRLMRELAQVQDELAQARAELDAEAGKKNESDRAGKIAAQVIVLEARARSIDAAIAANERQQAERADYLKSKEYRDAQKKIQDHEAFFMREADQVFQEFTILRDRLADTLDRHAEYTELVTRYCVELEPHAQNAKMRSRDYVYLSEVYMMLLQRHTTDKRIAAADAMTAEIIEARENKKKGAGLPVVDAVKSSLRPRQTDHTGKVLA